ncbi:hypothetical protein KQI52_08225 [bacterium]|nr:hypothetical protein [bacterium]
MAVVAFKDLATHRESYIQLEDPESQAVIRRFNITNPSNTTFLDTIPQHLNTFWLKTDQPVVVYSVNTKDSVSIHLLNLFTWSHDQLWSRPIPSGRELFVGVQPVRGLIGEAPEWLSIQYQSGDFDYSQCLVRLSGDHEILFDTPFGPALSFAGGGDVDRDGKAEFLAGSNAPSNGVHRNGLDDSHVWIVSLNDSGLIDWNIDLGEGGGGGRVFKLGQSWIAMRRVTSYVDQPFSEFYKFDPATGDTTFLAKRTGVLWSLQVGQVLIDAFVWRGVDNRLRILNNEFQPVAESPVLDPGNIRGQVQLEKDQHHLESFYVYNSPGETWLLNDSLEVISYMPFDYLDFYPAGKTPVAIRGRYLPMRDSNGEMQLVELEWQPWWTWWPSRYRTQLLYSTGTPLLIAFLVVGTRYIRLRRRSRRELELLSKRLELLSRDMMRKEDEHDKQIALRLHDNIGQDLTALKFSIHLAAANGDSNTVRQLGGQVDELIERVRQVSREIRPPILQLPICDIIQHVAAEFEQQYSVPCQVKVDLPVGLPEYVRAALYQVAREALANVARHANASRVWIECMTEDDVLICEIRDNGRGISRDDIQRVDAIGLAGMRERVGSTGGRLEIEPAVKGGTTVRVRIPASALVD